MEKSFKRQSSLKSNSLLHIMTELVIRCTFVLNFEAFSYLCQGFLHVRAIWND